MTAEYYIHTPLVSNQIVYFAIYFTQYSDGMWVVVDISVDNLFPIMEVMTCRKQPSGCVFQEMYEVRKLINSSHNIHPNITPVKKLFCIGATKIY